MIQVLDNLRFSCSRARGRMMKGSSPALVSPLKVKLGSITPVRTTAGVSSGASGGGKRRSSLELLRAAGRPARGFDSAPAISVAGRGSSPSAVGSSLAAGGFHAVRAGWELFTFARPAPRFFGPRRARPDE